MSRAALVLLFQHYCPGFPPPHLLLEGLWFPERRRAFSSSSDLSLPAIARRLVHSGTAEQVALRIVLIVVSITRQCDECTVDEQVVEVLMQPRAPFGRHFVESVESTSIVRLVEVGLL